jgi:phosphatidylglycerophosphatase A
VWCATGFGAGYLPVMPGTYGSALGVLLYFALAALARTTEHPAWVLGAGTAAVVVISFWVVAIALRGFREHDPQVVVLDEVAGQMVALLPLPLEAPSTISYWLSVAAGFLFFRALDAIKPFPIWKLERLAGFWGVMADDVAAGTVAAALLAGVIRVGLGL